MSRKPRPEGLDGIPVPDDMVVVMRGQHLSAAQPDRSPGAWGNGTRVWLTMFPTAPDRTHMAVDDKDHLARVWAGQQRQFPNLTREDWSLDRMPVTWECNGRDDCMVVA